MDYSLYTPQLPSGEGIDLAGHTMTLLEGTLTLIVLGGYSTTSDWNNQTYVYQSDQNSWQLKSEATGAVPAGEFLLPKFQRYHSYDNSRLNASV